MEMKISEENNKFALVDNDRLTVNLIKTINYQTGLKEVVEDYRINNYKKNKWRDL